jgi:hypothetical protein
MKRGKSRIIWMAKSRITKSVFIIVTYTWGDEVVDEEEE